MLRKVLVYLVLALLSIESLGCTSDKAVARGQSLDKRVVLASLQRRMRRDVEPVLDAGWKIHRRIEPGLEKTKDVMKKGLTFTGYLAALGGSGGSIRHCTTIPLLRPGLVPTRGRHPEANPRSGPRRPP